MKNACMMLLVMLGLAACNKPQESLSARLQKADYIEIEFYGEAYKLTNPVVIHDVQVMERLRGLVADGKSGEAKSDCDWAGKITFKKADSLVFQGEFGLVGPCAQVVSKEGEQLAGWSLTPAASKALDEVQAMNKGSKLDNLRFFVGRWMQVEGPELVSYENWERVSAERYVGNSWTMYQTDTVFAEAIALVLEGEDIYYIPTVKENAGPVRFKMTEMTATNVLFENPAHDFPQKISYESKGDTMLLARISGTKGGGPVVTKEFPLHRVRR